VDVIVGMSFRTHKERVTMWFGRTYYLSRLPTSTEVRQRREPLETKWHNYAVVLMTATVVFCAAVWAFLVPAYITIDDIVMFNPVYMIVHYGKVTFPTYGSFYEIVVHPPTHYVLLGWLAKLGVPLAYIAALPPFFLIALAASLISLSKFPSSVKLGLLFGVLGGSILPCYLPYPTAFSFGFRPDLHLAFAWFAGLIALETGRLDDWNPKRLFLGSALLTYASALHYPAFVAWTGVFVYIAWLIKLRGWRLASKPLLAIIAGGCLVGVPYLTLFVIPHWHSILSFVRSAEPMGGIGASVKAHLQMYSSTYYSIALQPFSRVLFSPLGVGIPTVLLSTLTLAVVPATRGIALASLPHLLMMLLVVQRKPTFGYFIPELILYVCGLTVCVIWALGLIARKTGTRSESIFVFASSIVLSCLLLFGTGWLGAAQFTLRPRILELDVARAAGKQMLGPNALVGARIGRFYSNGGDLSYMLEPDLFWRKIGNLDLVAYFEQFDAVAEDSFGTNLTVNEVRQSLASWYDGGLLNLHGFYFSSLHSHLSYLLLNRGRSAHLQGYGLLPNGQVAHFEQDPNGAFIFVAATCGVDALNKVALNPIFRNTYLRPASTPLGASEKQLETFVVRTEVYEKLRPEVGTPCTIRDEIRMSENQFDAYRFIAPLSSDPVIHFYQNTEDAQDARYGPELEVELSGDNWPTKATFLRGVHRGESYQLQLSSPKIHELFHSDMDSLSSWAIQLFAKSGGMEIAQDGLSPRDQSARYTSATPQDNLTSPFEPRPDPKPGLFFFSAWTKPLASASLPSISLQDEKYEYVARARPVIRRADGWVLLAGWGQSSKAERVRLVVQQASGAISLLDKAYIAEITSSTSVPAAREFH
jgi:hypothetical protein